MAEERKIRWKLAGDFPFFFFGEASDVTRANFSMENILWSLEEGEGEEANNKKNDNLIRGTLKNGRCINECSFSGKECIAGISMASQSFFNELLLGRNLSPPFTPFSTGGEAVSFLTRQSVIYTFGHLSYMLEIPQKIFIKFQNCFRIPTVDIYQKIYRFS